MTETFAPLGELLSAANCRSIVVCGGSQNAPALAYLQSQKMSENSSHNLYEIFHSFDERSAAFFALGLASEQKQTVAVLSTSGTAVAECVPALVEAKMRQLPLLLLSADKELEFHNTGFPQTCDHLSLTKSVVEVSADLNFPLETPENLNEETANFDELLGSLKTQPMSGPQHWNLRSSDPVSDQPFNKSLRIQVDWKNFLEEIDGLAILVSELRDSKHAQELCKQLGHALSLKTVPLYCETLSGIQSEFCGHESYMNSAEDIFQSAEGNFGLLKIGGAPLTSSWRDLVRKNSLERISIFSISEDEHHHLPDYRISGKMSLAEFLKKDELDLLASKSFNDCPQRNQSSNQEKSQESALIRNLHSSAPENSLLYLSNSLSIRLWERHNPDQKKNFHYRANRGVNGIDGQVSSFLGAAASSQNMQESKTKPESWMLVGDLTLLYDSNGLDFLRFLRNSSLPTRIVLLDNGGGQIFRKLPYFADSFPSPELARPMINPQERDWKSWADFWGLDYFDGFKRFERSSKRCLIHCRIRNIADSL
jgi:2-succinyl-5-enolpyruvyl-6-hydroxy-3-cyclohexene-1-carboxylate synthase